MTESAHKEFWTGRRSNKRRRDQASGSSDVAHDLAECRDTLGSVLEAARSVEQQMQALKLQAELGPVLFALSGNQRQAVQDAFSCTIYKGPMNQPQFAACCKTVIACKECLDIWYNTSPMCPKCRSTEAQRFDIAGLSEGIQALHHIIANE